MFSLCCNFIVSLPRRDKTKRYASFTRVPKLLYIIFAKPFARRGALLFPAAEKVIKNAVLFIELGSECGNFLQHTLG